MSDTPQPVSQKVEETAVTTGVVKFGFAQEGNPTPKWAVNVFRWYFYISGILVFIIGVEPSIPKDLTITLMKYITLSTMVVHRLSRMLGVDTSTFENESKN